MKKFSIHKYGHTLNPSLFEGLMSECLEYVESKLYGMHSTYRILPVS